MVTHLQEFCRESEEHNLFLIRYLANDIGFLAELREEFPNLGELISGIIKIEKELIMLTKEEVENERRKTKEFERLQRGGRGNLLGGIAPPVEKIIRDLDQGEEPHTVFG